MPSTRRSARLASSQASTDTSPAPSQSSPKQAAGTKRKSEPGESPSAKRGKNANKQEQKTIEETIDPTNNQDSKPSESKPSDPKTTDVGSSEATQSENVQKDESKEEHKPQERKDEDKSETREDTAADKQDVQMKDVEEKSANQDDQAAKTQETKEEKPSDQSKTEQVTGEPPAEKKSDPAEKTDTDSKEEDKSKSVGNQESQSKERPKPEHTTTNGDDAVIPDARKDEQESSSILEKGIIYFMYRGRVGIDEPSNVNDIARSYIILRPLPPGSKLGDGPIGDDSNCRLLALPKKVLPLSGKDRWTAFVEKAKTSFKELRDSFLGSSDYDTQTAGVRHSPAAVPAAEGIYAITTTGRESHLAYIVTLPTSLGEVQNDLGLRERGSFITSVKNPKYPGPAYADIGKDPGYSQDIQDDFRNLRWGPLQPKHLDYANCQFLLVGEGTGVDQATKVDNPEKNEEQPVDEMDRLEGEDEIRVKHLHGDDAVFADLETDSKSYPGLQTTW